MVCWFPGRDPIDPELLECLMQAMQQHNFGLVEHRDHEGLKDKFHFRAVELATVVKKHDMIFALGSMKTNRWFPSFLVLIRQLPPTATEQTQAYVRDVLGAIDAAGEKSAADKAAVEEADAQKSLIREGLSAAAEASRLRGGVRSPPSSTSSSPFSPWSVPVRASKCRGGDSGGDSACHCGLSSTQLMASVVHGDRFLTPTNQCVACSHGVEYHDA